MALPLRPRQAAPAVLAGALLLCLLCTPPAHAGMGKGILLGFVEGPATCAGGGERFVAVLSGLNNIAPNSTTPNPTPSPVKGVATVCVDAGAARGTWTLSLCGFTQLTGGYTASHIHVGASNVDFPPPLVPMEPPVKPADPLAPPTLLPQLPPTIFYGCRKSTGSFTEADIIPLPPSPLPTVEPITSFPQFLAKARAGQLYVNVHSVRLPAGEARGNLYPR